MPMGIVVISCVRPSVHGLGFVYCIQSAWKKWPTIWHADVSRWLTLSIHGCLWILLLVHLSVCSFTAFFLRLGLGQRRAVVIIGRWLLPSLVDTGDICCHYWQHILVTCYGIVCETLQCRALAHHWFQRPVLLCKEINQAVILFHFNQNVIVTRELYLRTGVQQGASLWDGHFGTCFHKGPHYILISHRI